MIKIILSKVKRLKQCYQRCKTSGKLNWFRMLKLYTLNKFLM